MDETQLSSDDKSALKIHQQLFHRWPPRQYPWLYSIAIVTFFVAFWFLFLAPKKQLMPLKPLPVVSALAKSADVPVYLSAIGNVTPNYTVTVRTQLNGQLFKVYFNEGQTVQEGALLAQIDPRPYEALLLQYQGNLKRDQALLANAQIDLKRYDLLWKQNSISQQIYATQQSLVKQYQGAVEIDEGLIAGTKVNLSYTKITSPIEGRIGLRLIDPGNFVQVSDPNGIAVVNTLQPITVLFALPEDTLSQVMPSFYEGKKLQVVAYDRQHNELLGQGTLLSIDNQIDPSTGTFKLRGLFDNKENKLFPNQFVNTKLLVQILENATLVPTSAIQHTTTNTFVFVIDSTNKAIVTPVVTGPMAGEDTVIRSGILPGQRVVTGGADKLKNGMQVISGSPAKVALLSSLYGIS